MPTYLFVDSLRAIEADTMFLALRFGVRQHVRSEFGRAFLLRRMNHKAALVIIV